MRRDILGIRLSMRKSNTDARLQEIRAFLRPDRNREEVWELRDSCFSHIIIGFDKDGELRFVTAVARQGPDAKRIPYSGIGALEAAQQIGKPAFKNFYYQWKLPREGAEPETIVIARGREPDFLATYSLKRSDNDLGRAKEDDGD